MQVKSRVRSLVNTWLPVRKSSWVRYDGGFSTMRNCGLCMTATSPVLAANKVQTVLPGQHQGRAHQLMSGFIH